MCYSRRRTSPRQWKSQHRRQRDLHAGVGLTGLRGNDGRPRVYGYLGRAQQPGFRVAIPDRVPVGSCLALLFALGKRVQRIPVDRSAIIRLLQYLFIHLYIDKTKVDLDKLCCLQDKPAEFILCYRQRLALSVTYPRTL